MTDAPQENRSGSLYHLISGGSLDRLAAISDGIFAVTMTLLVLELHPPDADRAGQRPLWAAGAMEPERALWNALHSVWPHALVFVLSFLTLGVFWVSHRTQLDNIARGDRNLTWLHLAFLLGVSFMPFTTALLGAFMTTRLALIIYWLNTVVLGLLLSRSLHYADRKGLLREDRHPAMVRAASRRIVISQVLYFAGILMSIANTYVGIGFIVLLQLISAVAPKIKPFDRF